MEVILRVTSQTTTQTQGEKKMKKEIMKQAWVIAKEMAVELGGSSKQYLSAAMKQAWAQAKNEEAAVIETPAAVIVEEVATVEAAPKAKKAPKKKKKTGEIDFSAWMRGINANFQVSDAPAVEAPKAPKQPVVRKTETAAEKRARRAANPELYAAPVKKTAKSGMIDFGAWMRGIDANC